MTQAHTLHAPTHTLAQTNTRTIKHTHAHTMTQTYTNKYTHTNPHNDKMILNSFDKFFCFLDIGIVLVNFKNVRRMVSFLVLSFFSYVILRTLNIFFSTILLKTVILYSMIWRLYILVLESMCACVCQCVSVCACVCLCVFVCQHA